MLSADKKMTCHALYIKALEGRAYTHGNIGAYDQAITDYQQAIAVSQKCGFDPKIRSEMLLNLAGFYGEGKSDFTRAKRAVFAAFTMIKKQPSAEIHAHGFQILGNIYKKIGDNHQALVYYRKNLMLNRQVSNTAGLAGAHCNIGLLLLNHRAYHAVEQHLKKYLRFSNRLGDQLSIARAWFNLGTAYSRIDRLVQAQRCLKKSLAISEKIGNKMGIGVASGELGLVYKKRGQTDQAMGYYQRYLNIAEEIGFRMGMGIANVNIGDLYFEKRDWSKALAYYHYSRVIAEEIGDREGIAICLVNAGHVKIEQKKFNEATRLLMKAWRIYKVLNRKTEAIEVLKELRKIQRPGPDQH